MLSFLLLAPQALAATPRIATLDTPGPARFDKLARDVIDVAAAIDPSLASNAGLFDDAVRVPSYSPANVAKLTTRLDADLAALRALPWRDWDVDSQIDVRWVYAVAETLRRQLNDERLYTHRPAQWLEPLANNLIALGSYAPDRPELQDRVLALVPPMLDEIGSVCTQVTTRDEDTARGLVTALAAMAESRKHVAARDALLAYGKRLAVTPGAPEFSVIGRDNYAWRLEHAMLLPWKTPEELLTRAKGTLAEVDARLATLPPRPPPPPATPEQQALARDLTRATLLGLYDGIEQANRDATVRGGWVTIPPGVGPIHARETPDAMVPLTGDGGSMNPPPTFIASDIGYWNVEHFQAGWTQAEREDIVVNAQNFLRNGMGPYTAHEGFPGHHLQLAIARLNPDPIRSILPDCPQNEGWGVYAEQVFFEHGGLAPEAEVPILRSWRHRINRVVFDTNIETGAWSLQDAADYKDGAEAGKGVVNEDLLRSINWPTQLVCYYSGKAQILELREAWRAKMGAAYSDRAFHDAFLAEGSIPIALIRAKMLGEPVPEM